MPRDNKSPLIQKIAKQANLTFKGFRDAEEQKGVSDKLNELISLVTSIRASDLKMTPRKSKPSSGATSFHAPPVTYMHICETEVFSMGVFLLRRGSSIPLHDHPGMNGMLKVLYGKVSVRCYDKLENTLTVPSHIDLPAAPQEPGSTWRSVLRSVEEYSENSGPCLLTPVRDNLHQIDAVGGPAAFLDILAPPYSPDDGRDCHYYRVLQRTAELEVEAEGEQVEEKEVEAWLMEVPQPDDFWCGGEPYPGPPVSV